MKTFREYTVRQGEEGKFKGWSKRAAADMTALNANLRQQSEDCAKFKAMYKELYRTRQRAHSKMAPEGEDETVDYKELWGLEPVEKCAI